MIRFPSISVKYYVIIFSYLLISVALLFSASIIAKLIGILFAGIGMNHSVNVIQTYVRTGSLSDNTLNVHQRRILAMNLPYTKVFDLCLESFKQFPEIILDTSDRDKGEIIAFYPLPAWSTLEELSSYAKDKISFHFREINNRHVHVYISSEPNVSIKIFEGRFDGGRNYQTLEKITAFLKQRQITDLVIPFGDQENCPVCGNK
jgi:hypothetical protein